MSDLLDSDNRACFSAVRLLHMYFLPIYHIYIFIQQTYRLSQEDAFRTEATAVDMLLSLCSMCTVETMYRANNCA